MNLGLDFGSTYSLVSMYDINSGGLQCLNLSVGGSPYIPSVVSYNDSTEWYDYGNAALSNLNLPGEKIYTTFKTLLNPNITEIKAEREYDEQHTPEQISYIFWNKIFEKIKKNYHITSFENVVIGIPELWGNQFCLRNSVKKKVSAAEGRKSVERILGRFDFIKNARIVSEPQAATAFFAYNYKKHKNNNQNLEGRVLLIDYGGGTLDITLSDVTTLKNGKMSIKIIDSDGEGENKGKLGSAGIHYMESLIRYAMAESGITDVQYNHSFLSIRQNLEACLRNRVEYIEQIFDSFINHPDKLKKTVLLKNIEYKINDSDTVKKFDINFYQMVEVYNKVIYSTLDKAIDKFIHYLNGYERSLKIGLVGGFGNYYLVRKQVKDKFHISEVDDPRISGLLNPEDREKAISLGCSVIANDLIEICETFEFGMGMYGRVLETNELFYNYGIKFRDEIKYDTVYYSKDKNGTPYTFRSVSGDINRLLINLSSDDKDAFDMIPKDCQKLKGVIKNPKRTAWVGFSIGHDKVIRIHVQEVDHPTQIPIGKPHVIPMSDFENMFDTEVLISQ